MNMKLLSFLRSSVLAAACLSLNACANEATPSGPELKAECVGRFQIGFPNDVDIATHIIKAVKTEGDHRKYMRFSDASIASYAGFSFDGVVFVSSATSLADLDKFKESNIHPESKNVSVDIFKNGFKSSWPNGADTYFYRAGRIYGFENNGPRNETLYKSNREYFLANFSPRATYAIPAQQGICIPYGFIKDDGNKPRHISVHIRLIDHPDVEIIFQDANAGGESSNRSTEYKGSRGHVQNFWSFYEPSQGNKLDGTINHYHDVDLGGYKGVYATATIARPIDQQNTSSNEMQAQYSTRVKGEMAAGKYPLDYGYMAYYKGDPSKPGDPDLMLSVIRTASRAVAVGKEPVTQEELYAMAKKIAASIKRREVK